MQPPQTTNKFTSYPSTGLGKDTTITMVKRTYNNKATRLAAWPFKGLLAALIILLGTELYLHNDDFLYRYRSVFAVGRAADKLSYIRNTKPDIIFLGNSRVDNGIDPKVIADRFNLKPNQVFNFGIPGINTVSLCGMAQRLVQDNDRENSDKQYILIGLDDSLFTLNDNLNYSVFFADRWSLLANHQWGVLLANTFRLWGFSNNLKGLREPSRLDAFLRATLEDRDSWGGSLSENHGYRAKNGTLTKDVIEQVERRIDRIKSLHPLAVDYFFCLIETLVKHDRIVAVYFPPTFWHEAPFPEKYPAIIERLQKMGVRILRKTDDSDYNWNLFSDPGHLNNAGAAKFSNQIASQIMMIWPSLASNVR